MRPLLPRLIAPGLLLLAIQAGSSALAQSPPPPPPAGGQAAPRGGAAAAEGPATQKDLNAYALLGAVNTCELVTRTKVPLQQALPSAAQAMAFVVSRRHGGRVQGINQALTPQQIFDGAAVQITLLVRQGCYKQLNPTDKKVIDDAINQIRAARGGAQGGR